MRIRRFVTFLILLCAVILCCSCGCDQGSGVDRIIVPFATAENWDPDPQKDGVDVQIRPEDTSGDLVYATGTVDATLWEWQNPGDSQNALKGDLLDEWTDIPLTRADYFGESGALVTLEYQNYVPGEECYGWLDIKITTKDNEVFTAEAGVIDSLS